MQHESRFPVWMWWIVGAITVLAVSILIFSVVLGVRAGQQQVEVQRRQQIGISLQRATDLQAEGSLAAALDEYQKVLVLDPSNAIAQQGIRNLLALASSGTPLAAPLTAQPAAPPATPLAEVTAATVVAQTATSPLVPPAGTSGATPIGATPVQTPAQTPETPVRAVVAGYWDAAQKAAKAGRWQEVLKNLRLVRDTDPAYQTQAVTAQLFDAYINLALEKDNADDLEQALQLYDEALRLQPNALDIQRERDLIATYLDVLTYSDADWPRAIELLKDLYADEPDYRDVEDRLQEAHTIYGDQLAATEDWCAAADEYAAGLLVAASPILGQKQIAAQTQCDLPGAVAARGGITATRGIPTPAASPLPVAASTIEQAGADGVPALGRIFYSARDLISGQNKILSVAPGKSTISQLLLDEASQPALRSDGARLAFRNLRRDQGGLSTFDPATSMTLRFSQFPEDSLPSWNPQGSRLVFASNREGDRLWRIYVMWAEADGGTETLGLGEAPEWHPAADQIVFRGCDQSGNACGLWTMTSGGASRAPLTSVPADDRPTWAPDGSFVAFMSNGRDGNFDIYTVDPTTRAATRLTDSPAVDVLPAVSPDGAWVAFVSNRDGGWKIYAVPSSGGPARLVAPVLGDMSSFLEQGMQWAY
jgi:TolB protein